MTGAPGWRHAMDIEPTSQAEIEGRRALLRHQLGEAAFHREVPCASCPVTALSWRLYRCLDCGMFFCATCARRHFGPATPP